MVGKPVAVGLGVQRPVLEQVEVVGFELAQPAASDRVALGDVDRLPAVLGRRDLDPERLAAGGDAVELVDQRLVERLLRRVVAGRLADVADGRDELPVEQRQRDREHDPAPARPEDEQQDGSGEQRPEPREVAAERGRDHEHRERERGVEDGADPQRAVLGGDEPDDQQGQQRQRDEGREHERLLAADREREVEHEDRDRRPEREPGSLTTLARQPQRDAGKAGEQAGDGARERSQRRERPRERAAPGVGGEQRDEAERDGEQERDPAGEQPYRDGGGEPDRAGEDTRTSAAVAAEAALGEQREQRRGGERRERTGEARPEQSAERWIEDAVGEQEVARVPLVVPDRESMLGEDVGAEGRRGEVLALGREDEVGRGNSGRDCARPGHRSVPVRHQRGEA